MPNQSPTYYKLHHSGYNRRTRRKMAFGKYDKAVQAAYREYEAYADKLVRSGRMASDTEVDKLDELRRDIRKAMGLYQARKAA